MPQYQKTCSYCGNAGSSKEHYWGRQSDTYLPPSKVKNLTHTRIRIVNGARQVFAKKRDGKPRAQTLSIACEPCNNGWMKEIYEAATPILKRLSNGEWWALTTDEKTLIAAWATLFTMTYEHRDREFQTTSLETRKAFMTNRIAPENWKIWIASCEIVIGNPDFVSHTALTLGISGLTPAPNTQTTTISYGQLLVHTFSTDADFHFRSAEYGDRFGLQSIWPIERRIIREPDKPHKFNEVKLIADVFLDANECLKYFKRRRFWHRGSPRNRIFDLLRSLANVALR